MTTDGAYSEDGAFHPIEQWDDQRLHLDGEKAVYGSKRMNPGLGRNFEAMDPLEWLARMVDHIGGPRQASDLS